MIGRALLFVVIGALSVAAALWLTRTPLGSSTVGLGASAQHPRVAAPVVRHDVSMRTGVSTRQGQAGMGATSPSNATSGATGLGQGGEQADVPMGVQESALSVAACPPGMSFVGQPGFCIDRYEYPNLAAVVPATLVSFEEAKKTCDAEGKRLCTDREWTQACLDLPSGTSEQQAYGVGRCNYGATPPQATAPVIPSAQAEEAAPLATLAEPEAVATSLAKLDKRTESGRMADCVSSSGVADLLGNVQEWVQSGNPSYQAAQKGGDFASGAPSCRSASNVRDAHSRHPGSGFRCCARPLLRGVLQPVERQAPKP